jgi:hypothetical protein
MLGLAPALICMIRFITLKAGTGQENLVCKLRHPPWYDFVVRLIWFVCRCSKYARNDHCHYGRLGSGSEASARQEVGEEEW